MNEPFYAVGFTGTRTGMTPAQRATVRRVMQARLCVYGTMLIGEHGDCIGADLDFDLICADLLIQRWCRPANLRNLRAHSKAHAISPPMPPMARNRLIVADANEMLACPPGFERLVRKSGTWATIGFAEAARRPITIVYPDGSEEPHFGGAQ